MQFLRKNSVVLIVLVGLILRVLYAIWMQDQLLESDAGYYVNVAQDIHAGKSFEPEWPPGLSYYLAGISLVFGTNLLSYVLAMLLLFLLFSGLLFKTFRLFLDEKWSLLGLSFFVINPTYIHHSVVPLTQLPIALCLVALFYFLVKEEKGWKIGLSLALAILTRAGSLALLPIALGYLLYKKRYKALPGFFAVLFLLIGTWQYHSWQMTDRWVWINDFNSYNFFLGNHVDTPDYKTWWLGSHDERANPEFETYYTDLDSLQSLPLVQRSDAFNSAAWNQIKGNPGSFVQRSLNRFRTFFAFDTYTGATIYSKNKRAGIMALIVDAVMFMLLGLGCVVGFGRKNPTIPPEFQGLLFLLILAYLLPYLLAFSHPTYHFPVSPLLSIFMFGVLQTYEGNFFWKKISWRKGLFAVFFLFIQIEWLWRMADRLG